MKFAVNNKSKVLLTLCTFLMAGAMAGDPEYDNEIERKFDYTNSFLAGFKSQETLPSATVCTKYLEQSIEEREAQKLNWANDTVTENWGKIDYVLNTTSWISYSLAPASKGCFMTGLEMYKWYLIKDEQFDSFGDVFTAWLQNLLGNVITFNSLYKKIKESDEAGNTRETMYWYGRFTTLFINFEPIEDDTLSDLEDFEDDDDFLFATNFAAGLQTAQEALANGVSIDRLLRQDYTPNREGPVVQGAFANGYGFTSGLVNATFSENSPQMVMCQTKIADTINNGKLFSQYVQNSDYDTMVKSAESFEAMIAAIHPITESCWFGLFEYGQTGQHYGKTFMDFSHLTYNMIHNAGKVYDTIFYLLKHQKTHSELKGTSDDYQQEWYFKLGIYYGTAIYLMFYSGNEPEPYDAYTDYQGLQNDEDYDF